MKNFRKITTVNGAEVPHKTLRGLRLAIKNNRQKPGEFLCFFQNERVQKWEISAPTSHTTAGRQKGKQRVGSKMLIPNYRCKLINN